MSRKHTQSDEFEEITNEMNDGEYMDEGFDDIDREDNEQESKKKMKKERKQRRKKKKMSNKVAIVLSVIVSIIAIGYVGTAV